MPKKVRRTRIKENHAEISRAETQADNTMKAIEHAGAESGHPRRERKPGHILVGPKAVFTYKVNRSGMNDPRKKSEVNRSGMTEKAGPAPRAYL